MSRHELAMVKPIELLDKFDIAHAEELLDHRVWCQYDLALLHLHCRPTVHDNTFISRSSRI
jgi:hypothetical protein